MTTARLTATKLTRILGGRAVVDGVSLQIAPGQVMCLLGPSGCGKSTTLRMIAGVEKPDAGRITLDADVVSDGAVFRPPEQRSVGLMFQDFALFPHLSVLDNVGFGLKGARRDRRDRAMRLLGRVGLTHHAQAFPHTLSGGEQQRVALARALAPAPKVMLMDEPFSGLDNRLRDGIRDETLDLLKEEGTAVLLVTHEPDEAMRMADEIALMRDGKIVQSGAPYTIYTNPVDKEAVAFFSDINVVAGTVQGALTETPFGRFLTPGLADGTAVDIVFRPQHVSIDFDRNGRGAHATELAGAPARARVVRARFMGSESLVEFRLDESGTAISATVPGVFMPARDTILWLSVRRNRCFVFPREL